MLQSAYVLSMFRSHHRAFRRLQNNIKITLFVHQGINSIILQLLDDVSMTKIKDITRAIEDIAPLSLQESYDNAGLVTGNDDTEVTGVLISLDVTEEIIEDAIANNCNLVVAHHPIIFQGIKKLTGSTYVERTLIKAIKNDIAIYTSHTNLDNVHNGVNAKICDKLGLIDTKVLAPMSNTLKLLTVYVPKSHTDMVRSKMNEAGGGQIGDYKDCSFTLTGQGRFRPSGDATPYTGEIGKLEIGEEEKIEMLVPKHIEGKVLSAMHNTHPYEEVAYFSIPVSNKNQQLGAGRIGKLKNPLDTQSFLTHLKKSMGLKVIRHTPLCKEKISTVAVCGGAGSFLLPFTKSAKADVFITGDFKYHEFFDAENKIIIADIGHYESEVFTKELIYEIIRDIFPNIACVLTDQNTNPITYF